MKLLCLQENLKNNFFILERVSSKNQDLPILKNVLLKTENGFLKAFTTDLEIGVEISIPCKIEKKGEVVVPIKLITDFISNLPNTKLTLEEKNKNLTIETEGMFVSIPTASKNDFPILPIIKEEDVITVNGELLKNGIVQVLNSVSLSSSIPEIAGVLFVCDADIIKIVGTDSFRLSEKKIFKNEQYTIKQPVSFILPAKTAIELSKVITSPNEGVEIHLTKNQALFKLKNINIISRLITGEYPKYEKIIPKTSKTTIRLNKEDFVSKIKLASLFSSKVNEVKIYIDAQKKEIKIKAEKQEKGEFSTTIQTEINGEDCEALFNYKYLLDGLSNINEKEIMFELNGSAAPAVFKTKEEHYQYVVMPIKT